MSRERVLDWRPKHDPRSLQYPITAVTGQVRLHNRTWRTPGPLDQGYEGACVGFAWTGEALTTPVAVDLFRMYQPPSTDPERFARAVYKEAQAIDEWEGEDYDGTSVLAGAKIMRGLGLLKEYRWAFSIRGVRDAILTTGPAVLGINWYEGMYEAPGGVLSVGGEHVGGHALLAHAYRLAGEVFDDEPAFGLFNSWGPHWGTNGRAWIRQSELARLLSENGEACIPYRRSYGR